MSAETARKGKTAFIVTAGCYSDHGIHGVFSSKKAAQKFIEKASAAKASETDDSYVGDVYWVGDDTRIEEWPLNEGGSHEVLTYWQVGMLLDSGKVVEGPHQSRKFGLKFGHRIVQFGVKVPAYKDSPIVRVESCRSADHALKLAADKRHEWLRRSPDER